MSVNSSAKPSTPAEVPSGRVARAVTWLRTSPYATPALAVASFMETLVVPIPIELILLPYMAIRRDRIWWIASVVLAGCLVAASLGYAIGYFLFDQYGDQLLSSLGWEQAYQGFSAQFAEYGFWAIVAIGVTPVPFQVAMLLAGAASYSLPLFLLAALIARGTRYYGLALLVHLFGERATRLWEEHQRVAMVLISLVVLAAFGLWWWR